MSPSRLRLRIPGVLTRNLRLKAGAVLLAVVSWGVVVYAANPPDSRTVQVAVPAFPAGSKFVAIDAIPPLNVRITGTHEHVQAFDPGGGALSLTVHWERVKHAGLAQRVPVTLTNNDADVSLDDPPTSILVDVDELSTLSVPVTYGLKSGPPPGFSMHQPVITPPSVLVSGPSQLLQGLSAAVTLDLAGIKSDYHQASQPVTLTSGRGTPLANSSLFGYNPTQVDVSVAIEAQTTQRTVPVVAQLSGNVAPGHQLVGVSVDPPAVNISGPATILNTIDSLVVSVALNGQATTTTLTIKLDTGRAGVSASPSSVSVHLVIVPVQLPSPAPTATPSPTPSASPT